MTKHVATFYTHYGALCGCRALADRGVEARLAPVPRELSSSCGTCVLFLGEVPPGVFTQDLEAVYRAGESGYEKLFSAE